MEERKLDAVIAASPENFYYCTHYPSFILYTARVAGLALAIIPRSESIDPVVIINEFEADNFLRNSPIEEVVTYPMWIHIEDLRQVTSPQELARLEMPPHKGESVDLAGNFEKLAAILQKMNLHRAEIGIEYLFFQQISWSLLTSSLPEAQFSDAASLFYECRCIKTPEEVECLRWAVQAAEVGVAASSREIREGATERHLASAYRMAVAREKKARGARHCIITVGEQFAPSYIPRENPARPGDLIKYDVGADCRGYGSDIGRTFVLGRPSALQETIYSALLSGHDGALSLIEPGVKMSDVFHAAQNAVRVNGIPNYTRGHVGHSVGLDERIEEPPFLSPQEDRMLSSGMVLCVEMPYYAYGVGAFQIEDMVVVTDTGHERLTTLNRRLVSVD